jgi:hypothetical protein
MNDLKRTQLINLGAEQLADTLLELGDMNPAVSDAVKRLLATPDENIKRYKTKLASLKRSQKFISWHESGDFAQQLRQLLMDLKKSVKEPCSGVELVGRFFEADASIFNRCDDSNGEIGEVFRYSATDLFISFASRCENKHFIADLVIQLNEDDGYGVRDSLFEHAGEYLPESILRTMIDGLWTRAQLASNNYQIGSWHRAIQMLAKQLGDAPLFEKARLENTPPSAATWFDIARVYLECGEPDIALIKLQQIAETEGFMLRERQQLLLEIYRQLGNIEAQTTIAWQIFNAHHDQTTLTQLLDCIGQEHRDTVINEVLNSITQDPLLSYDDAAFLLEVERFDELDCYLLQRIEQLNGNLYFKLLPLTEALEKRGKLLISSLIYRILVDYILARALSKYYHHGMKYLKKLDQLAPLVTDWQTWSTHKTYLKSLQELHKRKSAFWSKY